MPPFPAKHQAVDGAGAARVTGLVWGLGSRWEFPKIGDPNIVP